MAGKIDPGYRALTHQYCAQCGSRFAAWRNRCPDCDRGGSPAAVESPVDYDRAESADLTGWMSLVLRAADCITKPNLSRAEETELFFDRQPRASAALRTAGRQQC
jgi:hypothetical protein